MIKLAKQIKRNDNVVTAVSDFVAGETLTVKFKEEERTYICNQDVPFGHKVCIADVPEGSRIIKYGEEIGTASRDIKVGDWVHIHNVVDDYLCLGKDGNLFPGKWIDQMIG